MSQRSIEIDLSLDQIVLDGIEAIIEAANAAIDAKAREKLSIVHEVALAMKKIKKITELSIIQHDIGTPLAVLQKERMPEFPPFPPVKRNYNYDGEPLPASIDCWARGVIQTVKRTVENMRYETEESSSHAPSESGTSYKSSKTGKSSRTGHSGILSSRGGGDNGTATVSGGNNVLDMEDDDAGLFDHLASSQLFNQFIKLPKSNSSAAVVEVKVDPFDAAAAEIEESKKKIKEGSKTVINQDGRVVAVSDVKADALPQFAVQPALNIVAMDSSSIVKGSRKKEIRITGSRTVDFVNDDKYFQSTNSLVNTLSSTTEQLTLNSGVAIRSGDIVRQGPAYPRSQRNKSGLAGSSVASGDSDGKAADSSVAQKSASIASRESAEPQSRRDVKTMIAAQPTVDPFEGKKIASPAKPPQYKSKHLQQTM